MSQTFRPPLWLWVVLVITTITSLWVAAERHKGEASNRAVHMLVDVTDVRSLAASSGRTFAQTLADLKSCGITGIAMAEDNWDDLVEGGWVLTVSRNSFLVTDNELYLRLKRVLGARLPRGGDIAAQIQGPGDKFEIPTEVPSLRACGLGFDQKTVSQITAAGLSVVTRLANPPASTQGAIASVVEEAKLAGAEGVILSGDQVLGRRDLIPFAAQQIRDAGLWFGPVEFSNQGGLARMSKELLDKSLRVHSIVAAEMDKNEMPDIVDRYVRAVVERNVKVLFLRPVTSAADNPSDAFVAFVTQVRKGLEKQGYESKPARTDYPKARPAWAAVIVAMGVALTAGWLLSLALPLAWAVGLGVLFLAFAGGVYVGFGAKYLGFVAALVFPTWGVLAAFSQDNAGGSWRKWLAAYFWITAISVIGGLHVAALLTDLPFMLRLDQFMGVKAAHFVPPLIVGCVLLLQQVKWREMLDGKVRWFDIAMLGLVAVAMLFMLARTGNDAPGDVSSLELKMRNFLDAVLPERPRTKEFLIGYPALVLALSFAWSGRRRFLPLLAFLAAIGQASVLNTFCHLHTPIMVSIWRVITGLVVGGVFGLILLLIVNQIWRPKVSSAS